MEDPHSQFDNVLSEATAAMIAYLQAQERELAGNPLLERCGRNFDDVEVPLNVKSYAHFKPDPEEIRAREHCRRTSDISMGHDLGWGRDSVYGIGDEFEMGRHWVHAFRGSEPEWYVEHRPRPEPLDSLAAKLELAVILGDPGSGKTQWLKSRARAAIQEALEKLAKFECDLDDICFPVFMRLPNIAAELKDEEQLRLVLKKTSCVASLPDSLTDAERVAAAILSSLIKHCALPNLLAPWVWKRLTALAGSNRLILFLHAWDEVRSSQSDLARCLNAYAGVANTRIFLTSRIAGYTLRPLPVKNDSEGRRRELCICPLSRDETLEFVRNFFRDDQERGLRICYELHRNVAMAGLAQNPLLATILCMAFSPSLHRTPLGFPARRVEVYERMLIGMLGGSTAIGRAQDRELIYAKIKLLEEMAYHFFPQEEMSAEEIHDFLWDEKNGYIPKLDINDPLRHIANPIAELCHAGVLVPSGEGADSYLFIHLAFLEYLTARAMARQANEGEWQMIAASVDDCAFRAQWGEVIVMLAGLLKDPIPLLELLEDADRDDYFRHRLCLAVRCLQELPTQHPGKSGIRVQDANPTNGMRLQQLIDRLSTTAFDLWGEYRDPGFPHIDRCLPAIAQTNPTILEGLIESLCHENGVKWFRASEILGQIGETAPLQSGVISALLAALRDADNNVRIMAAKALMESGEAAAYQSAVSSTLLEALHDEDVWVKSHAAQALGNMAKTLAQQPAVISTLLSNLRHVDDDVQTYSAVALGAICTDMPHQPEVVTELLEALKSEDVEEGRRAASALHYMFLEAAQQPWLAIVLEMALRHADRRVRYCAALALEEQSEFVEHAPCVMSFFGPGLVNALMEVLRDPENGVRNATANVLMRLGDAVDFQEVTINALLDDLRDNDKTVRICAVEALGIAGKTASHQQVILNALLDALRDVDQEVRWKTVYAFMNIGVGAARNHHVIDILLVGLGSRDDSPRYAIVDTFGEMGAAAVQQPKIVAALLECLRDRDHGFCKNAAKALVNISKTTALTHQIVSGLLETLHLVDRDKRRIMVNALVDIGAMEAREPEFITMIVEEALCSADDIARKNAIESLGKIREAAANQSEMVDALLEFLDDADSEVRARAAIILGKMGGTVPHHPAVIRILAELALSNDSNYRKEAAEELWEIAEVATRRPEVVDALLSALQSTDENASLRANVILSRLMNSGIRFVRNDEKVWEGKSYL